MLEEDVVVPENGLLWLLRFKKTKNKKKTTTSPRPEIAKTQSNQDTPWEILF